MRQMSSVIYYSVLADGKKLRSKSFSSGRGGGGRKKKERKSFESLHTHLV